MVVRAAGVIKKGTTAFREKISHEKKGLFSMSNRGFLHYLCNVKFNLKY